MLALPQLTLLSSANTAFKRASSALAWVLVIVAASATTGCVASWNAPATRGVVVSSPPPAPLVESPPPPSPPPSPLQPAQSFVWVPGYWHWTGMEYAWIAGHWQQPPGRGLGSQNVGAARWAPPTYSVQPGGVRYQAGAWRYGGAP